MLAAIEHHAARLTAPATPAAHWFLRIGFGAVFLQKGFGKFFGMGLERFSQMMIAPNFGVDGALAYAMAGAVGAAEFAAGAAIILGGLISGAAGAMLTRLAALAALPVLLGAIFTVHWGRWAFSPAEGFPMGGMEYQVVLTLIALYFLTRPGALTHSDA